MPRTINRNPNQVTELTYKKFGYKFFNHTNWKGLCDDKNFTEVDQETFADCKNVYVDSEQILRSRPVTKLKHVEVTLQGSETSVTLANILDMHNFTNTTVYKTYTIVDGVRHYYLTFVPTNVDIPKCIQVELCYNYTDDEGNAQTIIFDNVKLIEVDNKIFVFSEYKIEYFVNDNGALNYYINDNHQYDDDIIYVPTYKVITGTTEPDTINEAKNYLTNKYIIKHIYTSASQHTEFDLLGKKLIVNIDGTDYEITFTENSKYLLVNKYLGIAPENYQNLFYGDGVTQQIPCIEIAKEVATGVAPMLVWQCEISNATSNPTFTYKMVYTTDGVTFTNIPAFSHDTLHQLFKPYISNDGLYAFIFTEDGPYKYYIGSDASITRAWTYALGTHSLGDNKINNNVKQGYILGTDCYIAADFINGDTFYFIYGCNSQTSGQSAVYENYPIYPSLYSVKYNSDSYFAEEAVFSNSYDDTKNVTYNQLSISEDGWGLRTLIAKISPISSHKDATFNTTITGRYTATTQTQTDSSLTLVFGISVYFERRKGVFKGYEYSNFKYTINYIIRYKDGDIIESNSFTKDEQGYSPISEKRTIFNGDIRTFSSESIHIKLSFCTITLTPDSSRGTGIGDPCYFTAFIDNFTGYTTLAHVSSSLTFNDGATNVEVLQTTNYTPVCNFAYHGSDDKYFNIICTVKGSNNKLYKLLLTDTKYTPSGGATQGSIHVDKILSKTDIGSQNSSLVCIHDALGNIPYGDVNELRACYHTYDDEDSIIKTYVYTQYTVNNQTHTYNILLDENSDTTYYRMDKGTGHILSTDALIINDGFHSTNINRLALLRSGLPLAITTNIYVAANDYVYTNTSSNKVTLLEVINENEGANYFVPDFYAKLSEYFLSKDNKLYITATGSDVEPGTFKWYLPREDSFNSNITNLHQITENVMGVFFKDSIYTITKSDSLYYINKSRIPLGCEYGSDIITTYDTKYTIFATKRGVVGMSYQDFISSTEQALSYLSDKIFTVFNKWNTGAIKIFQYNFWLLFYRTDSKVSYLFDLRNNSWWPIEYDTLITSIKEINYEPLLLSENNAYNISTETSNYYDRDGTAAKNVDWYIKSQILHLQAINYYKHIVSLTFSAINDNSDPIHIDLVVSNYRKKLQLGRNNNSASNEIDTFSYDVDVVRTFVKRLNYYKVNEFQYELSYNKNEGNNKLELKASPLSLTALTVKYLLTGQVR